MDCWPRTRALVAGLGHGFERNSGGPRKEAPTKPPPWMANTRAVDKT